MSKSLPTDCLILGMLMEGPAHGYDLWVKFRDKFGMIWDTSQSQVYSLLSRLEKEGYVSSYEEGSGRRFPKKVFRITRKGRERFEEWLESPVYSMKRFRVELLAKLYFLLNFRAEIIPEILEMERIICERKLEELEKKSVSDLYEGMVHSFKISHIKTNLSWIEEIKKYFESGG